jgi:hydrogenase nickel incorporation protein HypA/HybF
MHELSVAQGILDLVRRHVPDDQAGAVRAVTVRLGALSGVVAESLDFCFGAIVTGTPYARATLSFEHVAGDDLHLVAVELDDGAGEGT